jgi:beta-lactamase class A
VTRWYLRRRVVAPVLICAATAGCAAVAVTGATASPARPAAAARPAARSTAAGTASRSATSGACVSARRPAFAAWLSRCISRALKGDTGQVGLTVSDPHLDLACAVDQRGHFDAASTIKVSIISALLLKEGGVSQLTTAQHNLAWLMITQSDNNAATDLWNEVGLADMQHFLTVAGMKHTILNDAWGLTEQTPQDEMKLLTMLTTSGHVLSTSSRQYVLWLMSNVISSQRFGTPSGVPAGVHVSVKDGWLAYPTEADWHVNSLGAFRAKAGYYRIAVLTTGDKSFAGGVNDIQAVARVINKDIAKG